MVHCTIADGPARHSCTCEVLHCTLLQSVWPGSKRRYMAASVVGGRTLPSQQKMCAKQQFVGNDLLVGNAYQPADSGKILQETAKKRKLEAMQSESPDRVDHTSSEDEHRHDEFGRQDGVERREERVEHGIVELQPPSIPTTELHQPLMPLSVATEVNQHQEIAAERRAHGTTAQVEDNKSNMQPSATPVEVRQPSSQQPKMTKPPRPEEKLVGTNGKNKSGKTKRAASGKKSEAKSECVDRRRKRKDEAKQSSSGITRASAHMLFRCTCQLLRSQALDYDIRARELEERNVTQAKEIKEWEKRLRSLKRELQEYDEEQPGESNADNTSLALALVERKPNVIAEDLQEEKLPVPPLTSAPTRSATTQHAPSGPTATVEPTLPPSVLAVEAKLQAEIRKRTQKVNEFCKSVPGFIDTLDQQLTRRR